MEETLPRVNCVPCRIVEVRYEFPSLPAITANKLRKRSITRNELRLICI